MKTIFFGMMMLVVLGATAQQNPAKPKAKWTYAGIVQGGLIVGANTGDYTVQTIQGVKKGPWLLGIGAGIDNYIAPGFPVVVHGQYNYGKRRSKPFVYAQAGPQIPWAKNEWNDKFWETDLYNLKTGWLAEGGLGYGFSLGKKMKLLSGIGYSIKQANYDEIQYPWAWFLSSRWPPASTTSDQSYYHQKLTMNRLVLKVGVQF